MRRSNEAVKQGGQTRRSNEAVKQGGQMRRSKSIRRKGQTGKRQPASQMKKGGTMPRLDERMIYNRYKMVKNG